MIEENEAFRITAAPLGAQLPLVLDSPHSWGEFPADAGSVAPAAALRSGWDAYVDELWEGVTEVGGVLLAARFHRMYIDANRALDDIDPELLDSPWPTPVRPSELAARGMGLIRRYALPGVPMYDRPLTVAEVQQRIERFYAPYHAAFSRLLDGAHARFGAVWHVNCHSMKSKGNAMNVDTGRARPDFVVGDLHGTSADPEFTDWIAGQLRLLGYNAAVNDVYPGAELVRRYGNPAAGRHSVIIEINRALYLDEARCEKSPHFARLKADLDHVAGALADYVRQRLRG